MLDEKLSYSTRLYLQMISGAFWGMVSPCLVGLDNIS